ncbi:class I SAM-dependent methyltransferase [Nocardia sp. NPDC059177]|uniref:class I SAM-dependent methyltransferase n=1 Tax=Nocardia sp. NPDC059177 TaxID=3346759 RepID=UPI0036828712
MVDDARFDWLADLMDVRPGTQLLELGPGPGASLAHIARRLTTGRIVGLDRSTTATTRARERCAAEITAGRVRIVDGAIGAIAPDRLLSELDDPATGFDLVFASNVNAFWTGPATAEWNLVRHCLAPTGTLWLCYGYGSPTDPPTSAKPTPAQLTSRLTTAGFTPTLTTAGDLLAVRAKP